MKQSWAETLFHLHEENRDKSRWIDLYACHDQEDQGYFDMLDTKMNKKMVKKEDINAGG